MNRRYHTNASLRDHGPTPFTTNIGLAARVNTNFRTAIWTGDHLQVTLMSIPVGAEIGLERHDHLDQFLRVEGGRGLVQMGQSENALTFVANIGPGYAIFVPGGYFHNIKNVGREPLKLYSIYAPPEHPLGTVHETKEIADAHDH